MSQPASSPIISTCSAPSLAPPAGPATGRMIGLNGSSVMTDAHVIRASLSEPTAFETIFNRHVKAIHRYLARRIDAAAVEDLVAETFAVAFDQRDRYRHEYPDARPWLFGIATNLLRHHLRSERTRLQAYARLDCDLLTEALDASAIARTDALRIRNRLVSALGELNRGDRDALLLMSWGDLSYSEIALSLGVPIGTVRSRINRARRHLRELLEDLAATS